MRPAICECWSPQYSAEQVVAGAIGIDRNDGLVVLVEVMRDPVGGLEPENGVAVREDVTLDAEAGT